MVDKKHVDDADDLRVGYGKPPKHSRFKLGKSGNPSGRRRYRRSKLGDVCKGESENPLRRYLLEEAVVTINGKRKRLLMIDIIIKGLINKAVGGCTKSAKILIDGSEGLRLVFEDSRRRVSGADLAYLDEIKKMSDNWRI